MATIKDIAKAAGVSQGTVSNVLNGKENVSSDKIERVMRVVAEMGYTINEKAKNLRRGKAHVLAVIVPNLTDRPYVDFVTSFKRYAQEEGYWIDLYTTNDDMETERRLIPRLRSRMTSGVAVFSCLADGSTPYYDAGFAKDEVLFRSRRQTPDSLYLGFDLYKAGMEMGEYAAAKGYERVAVLVGPLNQYSKRCFCDAFVGRLRARLPFCEIYVRETTTNNRYKNALHLFTHMTPQAVFTENIALAQVVENMHLNFFRNVPVEICTFSPVFVLPEDRFTRYEADYRLMGKVAAQRLTGKGGACPPQQVLPMKGFSTWPAHTHAPTQKTLSIISIASPTTRALKSLINLYEQNSGTKVRLIEASSDSFYETLSQWDEAHSCDLVRLDVNWFPWFGASLFEPLVHVAPNIAQELDGFLPGSDGGVISIGGRLLAMPGTSSVQVLFYRKDLFEDLHMKRLFYERYKKPLAPPQTFEEYNLIAAFFTREFNPDSPVSYGTTLVTGNNDVAGMEFLTRYFSHTDTLFSAQDELLLCSEEGRLAMREVRDAYRYTSRQKHAWWTAATQEFARGDVAMTIQFINHVSDLVGPDSVVADQLAWSSVPGGNPLRGGSVIGISKYSREKELALDFIRWLSRDDIAAANTLLGGMSSRTAAFQSAEVIEAYPWIPFAGERYTDSHAQCYPSRNTSSFEFRQLQNMLGMAVNEVISGSMEVDQSLRFVASAYEQYRKKAPR